MTGQHGAQYTKVRPHLAGVPRTLPRHVSQRSEEQSRVLTEVMETRILGFEPRNRVLREQRVIYQSKEHGTIHSITERAMAHRAEHCTYCRVLCAKLFSDL